MILSIDCESTGLDIRHGCRPFFVTMCFLDWTQAHWEWDVDPRTRKVIVPYEDLIEIRDLILQADEVIGQNIKFDVAMILALMADHGIQLDWPWKRTRDTLIAGHTLHSAQPHDLTSMTVMATGRTDIKPLEDDLNKETNRVRRIIQQAQLKIKRMRESPPAKVKAFVKKKSATLTSWKGGITTTKLKSTGGADVRAATKAAKKDADLAYTADWSSWHIARDGDPNLPSAGGKDMWRGDTWLPREMARYRWEVMHDPDFDPRLPFDRLHLWWKVLMMYGNADSAATMAVWQVQRDELLRRGTMPHFLVRMHSSRLAFMMEDIGVTVNYHRFKKQRADYVEESIDAGNVCVNVAASYGYKLDLPRNGNNKSLTDFCFGPPLEINGEKEVSARIATPTSLNLPIIRRSAKTGGPSLDRTAMDMYMISLPERSRERTFISHLSSKRKRDKAIENLDNYKRFWIPLDIYNDAGEQLWHRLHPTLNPTGTSTLRWSSNNPNEQNISKQKGFNLRESFGPEPGYEWWSFDAENIELRIPAYEANEEEKIALFERPDDPPFYGSDHLLNFSIVYPDIWKKEVAEQRRNKEHIKKKYGSTYYTWCKNGDFAVQYGAIDRADGSGTADRAFHRPGAHSLLKSKFSKLDALNQYWIRFAEKHGYVETLPDRTVCSERGVPIECTRTEYGKILPTVPLNYHVQSTACWWMLQAMVRVQELIDDWRRGPNPFVAYIVLQVHDELVVKMPKSRIHPSEDVDRSRPDGCKLFRRSNLWRARAIQRVMARGGDDLIPRVNTTVSCQYHDTSYAEGMSL